MKTIKYNRRVDEDTKLTLDLPKSFRGKEVEIIVIEKHSGDSSLESTSPNKLSFEERSAIVAQHRGSIPSHLAPSINLEGEWYQQ